MSNNSEYSDSDSNSDTNEEILDTEDVIDTSVNEDECDITNLLAPEKTIQMTTVDKNKRISKNKLTKYELVRLIGERTAQLTRGAKPLIKQNSKSAELSYKEIAIEEIKLNMVPFKIKRPVNNHYEIWDINELDKTHLMNLLN